MQCHLMQPFAEFCCQKCVLEPSNYIFHRHTISTVNASVFPIPFSHAETPIYENEIKTKEKVGSAHRLLQ